MSRRQGFHLVLLGIVLYAVGIYAYLALRYNGNLSEIDTSLLTRVIEDVRETGSFTEGEQVYGNGMAYPAVSVVLMTFTGVSVQTLQMWLYPLIIGVTAIVAFVAYNALLGSKAPALLAVLMVYLQPDFLWVTWRGSHEKITWALTLLLLYLIAKSFGMRGRLSLFARYIVLFYVVAFALMTSNTFFASSFITTFALSFIGGMLFLRLYKRVKFDIAPEHIRRFLYITLSCSLLLYLFMFYLYPPASSSLMVLQSILERLNAIFLDFGVSTNPYNYVNTAWLDVSVYLALTAFSWAILAVSLVVWLRGIPRLIQQSPLTDLPRLFLWLAYGAFALQLAVSVVIDRTGAFGANFQIRLFTPLLLTAIPLAALGITEFFERLQRPAWRRVALAVGMAAMVWFSVAAVFKASNEPTFSNRWTFSTTPERLAATWTLEHATEGVVWVGQDERLVEAMNFYYPDLQRVRFDGYIPEVGTKYFVMSDLERYRWSREGRTLPLLQTENRIYDNGAAQVYYRRARTPYQR